MFLLLFIILLLVFSIPAVQTYVGKQVTTQLNKDFGTDINVGRVGLQFNGDVELKDVLVKDFKKDTLFAIGELNTSILGVKNLLNGKLVFGDIDIDDLTFNLVTYKDETDTNLDVFVARFDSDTPKDSSSSGDFILSSSDITIANSVFKMIDENKENPLRLDFNELNINGTDFVIFNSDVKVRINTLNFVDPRGVEVAQLATNFEYTPQQMRFDKLLLKTKNSTLNGDLQFDYKREDLQFFEDKVNVTANFKDTEVALDELNVLYNEFGRGQRAKFSADFSGTLNDLKVSKLRLNTSRNSKIYGTINFKNLFNVEADNFYMNGDFSNLSSNYYDLKALLPNVLGEAIPSTFEKLGNFTIVGNSQITTKAIKANIDIETQLGFVKSNLEMQKIDDIDNASYVGNIILDQFDLGVFLNDPNLTTTSLNLDVDGSGFTRENVSTKINGDVYTITYNNYTYNAINVEGKLQDKIFNGKLVANDPNAKLNFDGLVDFSKATNDFDFKADIAHLDLKTLNFYTKDSISVFKGKVDMKMKGTTINDAYGTISFKKTNYKNEHDDYYFEDFALTSTFRDGQRIIDVNSPDIIKGNLKGNFKVEEIPKLVENALGSIYTNYNPHPVTPNQHIDFNFKIYNKIVEVFYNDLKIGKNTALKGRVESEEKAFKLNFNSPRIALRDDYFANAIAVQVDNSNPVFNTYIEVDSLYTGAYNVSDFSLINVTLNDTLFMRSEFKGGKFNDDIFNLNFYHTINTDNKSVVGFKTSDVTFKNNTWYINEDKDRYNKVVFDKDFKRFDFNKFIMSHQDEDIKLSGFIAKNHKDFQLDFNNVDLIKITPVIDSLKLAGRVNGNLDIKQKNGNYLPNSTITVNNFEINDFPLGDFNANIAGNTSLTKYTIDASLENDISKSFSAKGVVNIGNEKPTIDLDVNLDKLNLKPLNPLLDGILSDVRGLTSGHAKLSGSLNRPSVDGELTVDEAGLGIPYLNVDYAFQNKASVSLKNQSFIFNNIELTDTTYGTNGYLNGSISHVNLSDWSLDLNVNSDRILILNTEEDEDTPYYGTGFMKGDASLRGATEQLVIAVEATTLPGTVFKIPLNDAETFGDNESIHFLTPEEKAAQLKGEIVETRQISGLELDFDVAITQDAEVELVLDKTSGSKIRGRGEGALLFDINTGGKFNIYGDISVFEGVYDFFYGGLVQKEFVVKPGGTLSWDGDAYKALLNIEAVYSTRANPSPLLDEPINSSIPVDVIIGLNGSLDQLNPQFNFNFPNLSSTIRSELNYRLTTDEDRSNQALYLLSTGAFSRGITDLNPYGTLAERLNGIVNGLLNTGNDKFNIGLNYEVGEDRPDYETDDRLGVTLQTKISDRILINGKFGVPVGGANQSVVAGDVQIDFLLNADGTLVAKIFNRENTIRNFADDIGYTQGVGISYNVEFDSFKELINKIFKGKPKTPKPTKEDDTEDKETPLPDNFSFKKSSDKN